MANDPYAQIDAELFGGAAPRKAPVGRAPAAPMRPPAKSRLVRSGSGAADSFGSFLVGAVDTVTFGYMDEAGAWLDTNVPTWMGGNGRSYEENVAANRAVLEDLKSTNGTAFMAGQIGGALLPVGLASKVGTGFKAGRAALRGGSSVRSARLAAGASRTAQMAAVGAVETGVYFSGDSNAETLEGRVRAFGEGATWGAVGGLVLGGAVAPLMKAGANKLQTRFARAKEAARLDVVSDDNPLVLSMATKADDALEPGMAKVGKSADDMVEDGALLTARELLGDPNAARVALTKRIGKLSEEDAVKWSARLLKAEAEGLHAADPHYRSLFNVKLPDGMTTDQVSNAVDLLEEASEALIAKARAGARTMGSIDHEFQEAVRQGITVKELEEISERSAQFVTDARKASHTMVLAGVQFRRAANEWVPKIKAGEEGARTALENELTKAAQVYALSKKTLGNWGRAGRALQEPNSMAFNNVADDVADLEMAAQQARIKESLKVLNDDDLAELVAKMRNVDDVSRIGEVLTDAAQAEAFSAWRRVTNSISLMLRSNPLTLTTMAVNSISGVGHDFFKGTMGRLWAAHRLNKANRPVEALALQLEDEMARAVYWKAHTEGFKAMIGRVKWEWWDSVEKVAGVGWGKGSITAKARLNKGTMLSNGFAPPSLRETGAKELARARVTDIDGFNASMDAEGGAFGRLFANVTRAGAVTMNTVDALATAPIRLFTGASDDYGRAFVKFKETLAENTRFAYREGLELGLDEGDLIEFTQRRAKELSEIPEADILARVEQRLLQGEDLDPETLHLMNLEKRLDKKADDILFMDAPTTQWGKWSVTTLGGLDRVASGMVVRGALVPFLRTPVRLFERGLVHYTAWGRLAKENKAILEAGGPEAEILKAQMEIGTMAIGVGMMLGLTGVVTATNGGYQNTRGMTGAPPNRLQIGDFQAEISRFDPFALTLTLGAMIGQTLKEGFQDTNEYGIGQGIETAIQVAWHSGQDSFLGKSYLQSLKNFVDILSGKEADSAATGLQKHLTNAGVRLIPLAGLNKQFNEAVHGQTIEAVSSTDQFLRSIPGAGAFMPVKRNILGDPIEGRILGFTARVDDGDELTKRLQELEIDLRDVSKSDPSGFKLSAEQLDRLRQIRGHEATDENGSTLREALQDTLDDPWFKGLKTKNAKQSAVAEIISGFNKEAKAILEGTDESYGAQRVAYKSFEDYIKEGYEVDEAEEAALDDVDATYGETDTEFDFDPY